jgi:ubiquinone biosynthesis protein
MLNKKYIPTPLVVHGKQKTSPPKPVRFRLLFVTALVIRSLLYVLAMRVRRDGKYTVMGLAQMTTVAFERLGGLWVKTAQILAMRRDIFPKEFCDELSRLHDRAHGFPGEVAQQIIEKELGLPIDEVFKEFRTQPVAAASIGQVHIGWLRENGKKVAIKVQRPTIAEAFRRDLAIVNGYMFLLRVLNIAPSVRWDEMYDELSRTLIDELDFRLEVASMRRMRGTLKEIKIYTPKTYRKFCTSRVLVMEFLDGVLMSDYIHVLLNDPKRAKAWCKENKINPKKFGRKLFISLFKQIFDDNMAHGDLHPGNIMMLKKSRIAFIDFGSISILDVGFLMKYDYSIRFLARKNFSKFAETFFTMVPGVPPDADLEEARKTAVRIAENWECMTDVKGVPYEKRALTTFNQTLIGTLASPPFNFPMEWSMLRLLRSMTALDASFRFVLPNFDWFDLANRYYAKRQFQMLRRRASKESRIDVLAAFNDALKLPAIISENAFFQADLFRKRAMNFQAGISKAARVGKALVGMFINIGLIATVFVIARYLSKQSDVGKSTLAQLPVRDVFGSMPQLSPGMWVVVIILSLYLLRSLGKVAKALGVTRSGQNPFLQGGS